MSEGAGSSLSRRRFVGAMAAGTLLPLAAQAQAQIRWSAGTDRPATVLPPGAIDSHHHIYDAHYPPDPQSTVRHGDALMSDYRQLQDRLGVRRHVLIQPSTYGTDNACLLDALDACGSEARGVAIIDDRTSDADLRQMHAKGIRGVRLDLLHASDVQAQAIPSLAARIAPLGWHIDVLAEPAKLLGSAALLSALPVTLVFDHFGRVGAPGVDHPAFGVIAGLLQTGRAWVKLSGPYTFAAGNPPDYPGAAALARAYVKIAPERLVWGTDWPHPAAPADAVPDDARMLDLVAGWIGPPDVQARVFVDNPARLYGF